MSWLVKPKLVRQSACSSYRYNNLDDLYSYLSLKSHDTETEETRAQKEPSPNKKDGTNESHDIQRVQGLHLRAETQSIENH